MNHWILETAAKINKDEHLLHQTLGCVSNSYHIVIQVIHCQSSEIRQTDACSSGWSSLSEGCPAALLLKQPEALARTT